MPFPMFIDMGKFASKVIAMTLLCCPLFIVENGRMEVRFSELAKKHTPKRTRGTFPKSRRSWQVSQQKYPPTVSSGIPEKLDHYTLKPYEH